MSLGLVYSSLISPDRQVHYFNRNTPTKKYSLGALLRKVFKDRDPNFLIEEKVKQEVYGFSKCRTKKRLKIRVYIFSSVKINLLEFTLQYVPNIYYFRDIIKEINHESFQTNR